jgi:putative tryptophan/tyrosine transport system substrate-binding protein
VIVTWGTPAALAVKQATSTIPIVMGSIGTILNNDVVPNLARPRGNITGFSSLNFEIVGTHVELLKDLIPGIDGLLCCPMLPIPAWLSGSGAQK